MVDINFKNIYKKYNNATTYAVEDFNLDIKDGEFIVFVGPSGCGKSTTLRMIAGLENITKGELYIDGKLMNRVPSKERGIAMVFQSYALYPHMSVKENMSFGLKLRKYDKNQINERVNKASNILGLDEYLNRKPAALSGGQRQRVALGRAIVRDADVFLMDEPLSNLDAKLRMQTRAEISRLHDELNATTIYVTHDQTEAMTMADRIVIMDKGIIQQIGTPEEVYDSPANTFVASFMGSPAMNLINLTYKDGQALGENGFKIKLNESQRAKLDELSYDGKEIVFGIRPEDILTNVNHENTNDDNIYKAKIDLSELLGSESMFYITVANVSLIVKANKESYRQSEYMDIGFNLDKSHIFDAATGESLTRKTY
ncbi:ABC transporter ATP-binding protein [Anaerococcus urinomassiliensis]|uniref:ABC transporter ATP-binding protein n=1 Tax=Anaerococcus urinomassiliensis TaxID=1745712 RepID=UPI00093CA977|nr:sn-glycerol-3-phosphate ABC transporter ATP-binding protein UgpC [Anaerococcus urinomassiliensis]